MGDWEIAKSPSFAINSERVLRINVTILNRWNLVVLSPSHYSSPLIAFNVILKDIKQNKRNPLFDMNGSHIIVITPSVPIYIDDRVSYNVSFLSEFERRWHRTIFTKLLWAWIWFRLLPFHPFKLLFFGWWFACLWFQIFSREEWFDRSWVYAGDFLSNRNQW